MESFVHTGTFLLLVITQVSLTVAQEDTGPSCMDNNIIHANQAVWKPEPCNICVCDNGHILCDKMDCEMLDCPDAEIPPGDCCPVCPHSGPASKFSVGILSLLC
uniref:VWFC domain-containing protein n=1 Tax=Callorhinchus milii TaxID=7868 RepID=A0A4W3JUA8_CALMI